MTSSEFFTHLPGTYHPARTKIIIFSFRVAEKSRVPRSPRIPRTGGTTRSVPAAGGPMTRLICLLAPFALVIASGCAHCGCGDPDPTPSHTFGHGGVVERGGGLRGPREFCPMCEWAGTKCDKCRAKEAAECAQCRGEQVEVVKVRPKGEAERLLKSLETKKIAVPVSTAEVKFVKNSKKDRKSAAKEATEPEESEAANGASPYAPLRGSSLMHTTR
jgi:hypothetical protein